MTGFKFKETSSQDHRALMEDGIYAAAIVQVADIGLQRAYDRAAPPEPQLAVAFELADGTLVSKRMKFSDHPASNCYALFNAAFPDLADDTAQELEPADLLGRSVLIDIDVNERGRPRVICITPPEIGFEAVAPRTGQIAFNADAITKAQYMRAKVLSTWLRERAELRHIHTVSEAVDAVHLLKQAELLELDIETAKSVPSHPQSGLNPHVSKIRLVQYFDGKHCFVFDQLAIATLDWLTPLLSKNIVVHNTLFEAHHSLHAGVQFSNLHDSMLMARVFFGATRSLRDLASDALDLDIDKTLQTSDWSRPELFAEQLEYAAADAVVAYELAAIFEDWFDKNEAHYRGAYKFLRQLIYPLVRQMNHGVPFDSAAHSALIARWKREREDARRLMEIENPNSTVQKQVWLQTVLTDKQLFDWPLTKSGNLSTSKETLAAATHIPAAAPLARYTSLNSGLNNFGDKLQRQVIAGRLFPGYQIAGMVTGWFSCSRPNIQNIPRDGFKDCFRAPDGFVFVTGDLSQIELRVAGILLWRRCHQRCVSRRG